MKTLLLLVTLFAFFQSAFLPVNLVLVLIIARSLVIADREALFLGFFGGIIFSFLTQANLGYWPIIFLICIKLIQLLKKVPIASNLFTNYFFGLIIIIFVSFINQYFIKQEFSWVKIFIESLLILPAYFLTKIWEERFIVKNVMKLRV